MADIVNASTVENPASLPSVPRLQLPRWWSRIALGGVLLLSLFMNFFQLGQNGYGNLYYAAGVRSMADNFHNFFFVSFDPGGFVTVDKPPVGFWLQTISTKIFGFTPFSIFLPQALCGFLAVLLLYFLVRRHFGEIAGLIAALVLAVTPISVVTDRNNTIDGTLALVLILAAWAVIRAAESGKLRWLLLSAAFVGLGFNIKMAEAYLVVPALGITYLLCAPGKIWTRVWHLAVALLVLLLLSLSWAATVDLIPASQRPYVGSTKDNSELSLAFGYNGLNRLHIGGNNGYGGRNRGVGNRTTEFASEAIATPTPAATVQPNNIPSGSGGTFNRQQIEQLANQYMQGGASGPLSLFGPSLGPQIAWLLPFGLLAIVALAWQRRPRFQTDRQQLALLLWGFWLLTMTIFFTLNGSFHQYYMTEMSPGLAAMVGIGTVVLWKDYLRVGWRGWLLPLAFIVTAGTQIYLLSSFPDWSQWMSPLIGLVIVIVALVLIVVRLKPDLSWRGTGVSARPGPSLRVTGAVVSAGFFMLLLAPTIWSGYSVIQNTENSAPTAGPNGLNDQARGVGVRAFSGGNQYGRGSGAAGFGRQGGNGDGLSRRNGSGGDGNQQTGLNAFAGAFGGFLGGGSAQADPALISYLEAHQGNTKFLVATPSSATADPIILTANKPVMALGGFGGSDPILTTEDLQNLIHDNTIRFFLLNSPRINQAIADLVPEGENANQGGGFNFGAFGTNVATGWVTSHCRIVPASQWQSQSRGSSSGTQLYDCASVPS
ncbi:glycosyltransferase family 39 protein [Tengunoibacter tsumagoiensis]|uniref:Uncharacterized protein n=1 Tax=Tengunoibacter tsumagoiensis TaxID=2014871 RepID=A0A402AAG6_9CHLR|nr:glycosyltransferase family 39 protein [Tengunoibacter tsumagoiensis]GCE16163.1 hypothetical protein KTT_60220 [Tengunoibacter tsumagoiensis]